MAKISKKGKIIMIVIGAVLAVVILFLSMSPLYNNVAMKEHIKRINKIEAVAYDANTPAVIPELADGIMTFTTDRELKILQLTDIHISGSAFAATKDKNAMTAVEKLIRASKPDLVIVTGDLNYATPLTLSLDNSRAFKMFSLLMEKLGVYWTIGFGNHDSESYNTVSRRDIGKLISGEEYPHCIFTDNYTDIFGVGNQFINVKNSKNIITQTIVVMDSNDYAKGKKGYDIIHDDQIDWYEKGIKTFSAHNKNVLETLTDSDLPAPKSEYETVKSIAFFHIPLEEYQMAANEVADKVGDTELIYGGMEEKVCKGYADNQLFEKMLELASTKAIFVGHDHVNNACFNYKGIKLAYSYSIDYLAYSKLAKTDDYRGGTVITVKPNGSFTNELLSYKTVK